MLQVTVGGSSILFGLIKSAHTVGLRNDGTLVPVGEKLIGQCDVNGWTDVVQVAAGMGHTVGLRGTALWSLWAERIWAVRYR